MVELNALISGDPIVVVPANSADKRSTEDTNDFIEGSPRIYLQVNEAGNGAAARRNSAGKSCIRPQNRLTRQGIVPGLDIRVSAETAENAFTALCVSTENTTTSCSVITVTETDQDKRAYPGLCLGPGNYAFGCTVLGPVVGRGDTKTTTPGDTGLMIKLVGEVGLGANIPLNRSKLGSAGQETERGTGIGGDGLLYLQIGGKDKLNWLAGVQVIGGQTVNNSLINPFPFPSGPFGGDTTYFGGLFVVGANYQIMPDFALRAYLGGGFASVDFTGVQNGVTVVRGSDTVEAVRVGLAGFYRVTDGVEVGVGVDWTYLGGFNTQTNTGVPLIQGSASDLLASVRVRFDLGYVLK